MLITRRRMDFLQIIIQLFEATKLPVHYTRVAELLRVSKWSAYEMLKALEKEGLLTSRYEVNQGEKFPGRAMVLFAPTHLAETVLSCSTLEDKAPLKEWRQVRQRLLFLCEGMKGNNLGELIEQLMVELPVLERPMIFSAHMLTLLIAQLQTLSAKSIEVVKKVVLGATNAETGLATFVGVAMGNVLKTATQLPPLSQIVSHLERLQDNIADLNQFEQDQLRDFLEEALERAT